MVLTEEALHRFFFFLGTTEGFLLIKTIELVFFSLITYMIISEFLRVKSDDLQYLALAFGLFSIQKLILSVVLWFQVFGLTTIQVLPSFLPVMISGLELLAIVMLINAFA